MAWMLFLRSFMDHICIPAAALGGICLWGLHVFMQDSVLMFLISLLAYFFFSIYFLLLYTRIRNVSLTGYFVMDLWISKEKKNQWSTERAELSYFIRIMTIFQSLKQAPWHLSSLHRELGVSSTHSLSQQREKREGSMKKKKRKKKEKTKLDSQATTVNRINPQAWRFVHQNLSHTPLRTSYLSTSFPGPSYLLHFKCSSVF